MSLNRSFVNEIEEYSDRLIGDWKKSLVQSFSFWPPTAWKADAKAKVYGEIANDLQKMVDAFRESEKSKSNPNPEPVKR